MPDNENEPTIVLVHGAFAESASWNGVVERLSARGLTSVAVANPLRDLAGDADYVRDVIASLARPVVLAGHSYGGQVITQAAAGNPYVQALVFVSAFAPQTGESALELSGRFPGSTLGAAVVARALTTGGAELSISVEAFARQFAADADPAVAALMAVTQRPVAERALTAGLTGEPAWSTLPSWFIWGDADRNIPAQALRFMAERAKGRELREIPGAGHALTVSQPAAVTETILAAVAGS
ncbi:alpha/beta hydrolase [Actinoplanes philippinensis]|uniref:Pimeloyl-ACP methyl ester carboxylesterase n=1 Tax=Actinoplanes philippinensis TaxID=35752 RepID=A0A1I2GFI4_9ACTN|nr:alpha/beta hydrolase [Actinoplanes philippinensis]GIE76882.1 alpha/beta hydrolase [Actinoplanes philippinensis]SFF15849.1 Pimeloyl-ACP methyl ester carboxylesterase [Actinoplanes philippinensis]